MAEWHIALFKYDDAKEESETLCTYPMSRLRAAIEFRDQLAQKQGTGITYHIDIWRNDAPAYELFGPMQSEMEPPTRYRGQHEDVLIENGELRQALDEHKQMILETWKALSAECQVLHEHACTFMLCPLVPAYIKRMIKEGGELYGGLREGDNTDSADKVQL